MTAGELHPDESLECTLRDRVIEEAKAWRKLLTGNPNARPIVRKLVATIDELAIVEARLNAADR